MAFLSDNIGLCKNCGHHRVIKNDRGNAFYLCRLAESDTRFAKYPRLPVLRCEGYAPRADQAEDFQTNDLSPIKFKRPQK